MQPDQLLLQLEDIKSILSRLIGTSDLPEEARFSEESLDKVAKDFEKMRIERGDWVTEDQIGRYIKTAPYNAGRFIRDQFAFSNWFKKGREYLYAKKDLIALAKELESRQIDLKRYQEFLFDKAAFDKRAASLENPKKKNKGFKIPLGVKNITTSEIPKPGPEKIREDLARLKQEFKAAKFEAYIDIYKGTHAMLKHIYHFQKYLEPDLKRRCSKWCDDFNYANRALELVTGKKEKFAIDNPDEIQL